MGEGHGGSRNDEVAVIALHVEPMFRPELVKPYIVTMEGDKISTGHTKEELEARQEILKSFLDVFAPHIETLTKEAQAEVDRFNALFAADHNAIGRVLKVHLVVEHYLDEHLQSKLKIENVEDVRLTFVQKARMLSKKQSSAAFVRAGILQLNAVRNKFSHTLNPTIEWAAVNEIVEALTIARPGVKYAQPIEAIEAFAPVACSFLAETPDTLRTLMEQGFKNGTIKVGTGWF